MKTYEAKILDSGRAMVLEHGSKKRLPGVLGFATLADAERYAAAANEAEAKKAEARKARQNAKKAALASLVSPYQVGDVLYNSWGYEQTNIDYYQVVAVKGRSVTIRPIAQEYTEKAFMSGETSPKPGVFTGPAVRKLLQVFVDYRGTPGSSYLPMEHGAMSLWRGQPVWSSHYA